MKDNLVVNNKSGSRFECLKNGHLAVIEYEVKGDKILLLSTQVPPEISGQGVGSELIKQSFELIENMDLKVVPVCSFIQNWLRKNPDKKHLIT